MRLFDLTDYRSPASRARGLLVATARATCKLIGRYRPYSPAELETVPMEQVSFAGDIPVTAAPDHHQVRRRYAIPRAASSTVANLIYTPNGMAWAGGALHESQLARAPGLRDLLRRPDGRGAERIPRATLIEKRTPYTYGDWYDECLAVLAANLDIIVEPIVLPQPMAARAYASRDLDRLVKRSYRYADRDLLIDTALVLHQTEFIKNWTAGSVSAMRRLIPPEPVVPEPGSVLYLSRQGVRSEAGSRSHPHELVSAIVTESGGQVLMTAEIGPDAYKAAAWSAETVIADHGSALYALIHWRTARVVELVTDSWWSNCFLFYADALGISDYTIIRTDLPVQDTERKLRAVLAGPVGAPAATGA